MRGILYPGRVAIPFQSSISHEELTNEFIRTRGVEVSWQRAVLCPCLNENGVPRPTCPKCIGRGFFHLEEVKIPVLFTRLSWNPGVEQSGLWVYGMSFVSTPGDIKLGMRDRLRIDELCTVYSEVAVFENGKVLLNFPPLLVEQLLYFSEDGKLCDARDAVSISGNILSFSSLSIPEGTLFSIRYLAPLSFLVMSAIHEVRGWKDARGTTISLPNQYVVQREDMVLQEKEAWFKRG